LSRIYFLFYSLLLAAIKHLGKIKQYISDEIKMHVEFDV